MALSLLLHSQRCCWTCTHSHYVSGCQEALEEVEAVPYHPWWPQGPTWLQSFAETCASESDSNPLESLAECFPLERLELQALPAKTGIVVEALELYCCGTMMKEVLSFSESSCSMQAGAGDSPQLLLGCQVEVVEVGDPRHLEEEESYFSQVGRGRVHGCWPADFDPLCFAKPVVGWRNSACQV